MGEPARTCSGPECFLCTTQIEDDPLNAVYESQQNQCGGTWAARADIAMTTLSGKTPPALRAVLTEWPLLSAPMAELLTGASRAAVQRNFAWMEARRLVREVTGQGRYRMWRTV